MDQINDQVNYGLHHILEQKLVNDIYNSISYEIDIDDFEHEDYRKAALEACFRHIEDSMDHETSLKAISYRIEDRSPEHADMIAKNVEIDMDSRELARVYKQAYDEASIKADEVERTMHDKAMHFLIEQAIESNTFERDFDAVFSEILFKDHTYQSKQDEFPDVKMNKHRKLSEIPGSDADFWRIDLENEEIDLVEVKTSDKEVKDRDGDIEEKMDQESIENADLDFDPDSVADHQSRRKRQLQQFEEVVEYANEQVGTNFDVNTDKAYAEEMLDPEDEPNFYTGDYHLADGIEPADLEKLEIFVNELMVNMSMDDADQIETVSPEEWAGAV